MMQIYSARLSADIRLLRSNYDCLPAELAENVILGFALLVAGKALGALLFRQGSISYAVAHEAFEPPPAGVPEVLRVFQHDIDALPRRFDRRAVELPGVKQIENHN